MASAFVCSTTDQLFTNKEELSDHYKSDLHRYNLKRKVAGLPPVTSAWFEARRAELERLQKTSAPDNCTYVCSLTGKRFQTRATYDNHTKTKKFKQALKQANLAHPPDPQVVSRTAATEQDHSERLSTDASDATLRTSSSQEGPAAAPSGTCSALQKPVKMAVQEAEDCGGELDADELSESGWETESSVGEETLEALEKVSIKGMQMGADRSGSSGWKEAGGEDGAAWVEWDLRRSLFDGHVSRSLDDNLRYMQRTFGFVLPNQRHLRDVEGMVRYLGAKLQHGKVPLYSRGDDPKAPKFGSLQAVQQHMLHVNKCFVCYAGNQEEYEDFYDDSDDGSGSESDGDDEVLFDLSGSELVVCKPTKGTIQVLGSRDLKYLYRQKHRPLARPAPGQGTVTGVGLGRTWKPKSKAELDKQRQNARFEQRASRQRLQVALANDKISKLPKNVPY